MDDLQRMRLAALRERFCDYALVESLYGIGFPAEDLMGRFRAWSRKLKVNAIQPDRLDRFWFETFFQRSKLLPRRWAAARLGMTEGSLEEVMNALVKDSLATREELEPLSQVINEEVVRRFHEFFPAITVKLFKDNNDSCRALHDAIQNTYRIGIEPLICVTSAVLGEDPPRFAYEFDAITGDPVSLSYQVWLDLGKPMNLRPDCCSLKFYCAERETLNPLVFTNADDLEERFGEVLQRLGRRP